MSQDLSEPTVQQLFSLAGRVALITGASGYLGSAMSRALAEAGASVVVTSRDGEKATRVADALPVVGAASHAGVALDHMRPDTLAGALDEAIARSGPIDVLVNNGNDLARADWTTVTSQQFSATLDNATGYFELSRLVRDRAVERGRPASIVLLGSMYGLVGSYPQVYEGLSEASPVAYQVLKAGVIHLTRHLAVYWAADGVRVNCLSPGPFPKAKAGGVEDRLTSMSPMRRMGQPAELKGAVVFLASDASSYMTGQNLVIDGGWTAW